MKPLIISTDIGGGDPDDTQSAVHLLHMLPFLNLHTIIVGRPKGRIEALKQLLKAYEKDRKKFFPHYPPKKDIESISFEGATRLKKGWEPLKPVHKRIIKLAKKEKIFWAIWGAGSDLAICLRHAPEIAKNIEAHFIGWGKGVYNYDADPELASFLDGKIKMVKDVKDFRQIYLGKPRLKFVKNLPGKMGEVFREAAAGLDVNRHGIKMGDTPSLFKYAGWSLKNWHKVWVKKIKELYE